MIPQALCKLLTLYSVESVNIIEGRGCSLKTQLNQMLGDVKKSAKIPEAKDFSSSLCVQTSSEAHQPPI
jgi:hypothetical protein